MQLLSPLTAGALQLPNRILMAPLTRCRAGVEHLPNDLMAEHYAQRASAGLLITVAEVSGHSSVSDDVPSAVVAGSPSARLPARA